MPKDIFQILAEYKKEQKDAQASLYEELIESIVETAETKEEILEALNNLDHPNALEVDCIHCSTGFNNNDHFFIPEELYAARSTPINQLADWMHDRDQIVGCISDTQVKDFEGVAVSFDPDEEIALDEKFDLHASIVVWAREKEEYAIKVLELYDEGKLFVSMETTFDDYDFALEKDGKVKIVKRNKETAFLKNSLRKFGGTGKYKGFRVGIAFRDIKFTGVGFIDGNEGNPANERSDVTDVDASRCDDKKKKKEKSEKNSEKSEKIVDSTDCLGVTSNAAAICENKGENIMDFEKLYEEAKAALEAKEAEAEAQAKESSEKIQALEAEVTDLKADAAEVRKYSHKDGGETEHTYTATNWDGEEVEITENTVFTSESVTTVTETLVAELASAKEELSKKNEELAAIAQEKKNEERKAAVAELDVEIEDEELFAMSDEEYATMVKFAPKKEEESLPAKDEEASEEETEEKNEEVSDEEKDEEAEEEEEKDEDEVAAEDGVEDLEETEEEEEENLNEAEAAADRDAKGARTAVAQLLV